MSEVKHTPGPWEYIASTEHHGAYVAGPYGDICDCYTMSNPLTASTRNGGDSCPVPFQGEYMDANARLIAAAPELLESLKAMEATLCDGFETQAKRMAGRRALISARAAIAKATGAE